MQLTEKYEYWMELETSYALTKFSPQQQLPYLKAGITRGNFSFMTSVMNYVQRAAIFTREMKNQQDALGLQVALNLGKTAHNLVALDATIAAYYLDRPHIASGMTTFSALATHLMPKTPPTIEDIDATKTRRRAQFSTMQMLQDGHHIQTLRHVLQGEAQDAANIFTGAAEIYGWPTPGERTGPARSWDIPAA